MSYDVLPSQIRAARALINMSQEELAAASNVSVSTIRDYEAGRRHATGMSIEALCRALEHNGIIFTRASKKAGPGVCLAGDALDLVRMPKKVNFDDDTISFDVRWRGEPYRVVLPVEVLEDLDRSRDGLNEPGCIASFEQNLDNILDHTLRAIHATRADENRRIRLRSRDFFPWPTDK